MRKIQIDKSVQIIGGVSNRTCAIVGGLAAGAACCGLFPAAFTITAAAAFAGCFD